MWSQNILNYDYIILFSVFPNQKQQIFMNDQKEEEEEEEKLFKIEF